MTQESINDLVKNAANQLSNVWGNEIIDSVSSVAVICNTETGERIPSPRRKLPEPTTASEIFAKIHTPILQKKYTKEVLPFINTDIAEIPLIGAKNANEHYLKEAEKNRLRILEIRYEMHTKSEDEFDKEESEEKIYRCRIDQIENQMYADFYNLIINNLSKPKPTTRQYALYYHYLQESGCYPQFKEKLRECEEIGRKHGFSAKNFQLDYNAITKNQTGKDERLRIVTDLQRVIEMLSEYPDAQSKARLELNSLKFW